MPVEYGLLSANLNLPIEQMVQIKTQQAAENARLGLQAAQMRQQAQMQAQAQAAQRAAQHEQIANQSRMQQDELRARQQMQAEALAEQERTARLPYEQMTQGQQVQQMGYRDAERERQIKHQQFAAEQERALANDAAKEKYNMMKLEYERLSPKSAEAKFAQDFVNEKDPQIKQLMMEQRAAEAARNNQTVSYGRDENGNVTVSVSKGGAGGGASGAGATVTNKLKEENIADKKLLTDLDNIESLWKPTFSTTPGQLKYETVLKAQRSGIISPKSIPGITNQDIKDATTYSAWTQQVGQYFNQYRKEITGAGASNLELENLMKTMVNTSQGPEAFKASMEQAKAKMQRYMAVRDQALNSGLTPGTPAFSQYVDKSNWYVATPVDHAKTLNRFQKKKA